MLTEPPPTPWTLARPPDDHPHDAWAVGADLEPGTLVAAYRPVLFPMRVDGELVWWSPAHRAVIPIEGFAPSRSLRRAARGFEIRVDTAFARGDRGLRRSAPAARLDRRRLPCRLHTAPRVGLGALRRGLGRGTASQAASTASRSAASSRPSRCSTGARARRRRRCSGLIERLAAAGGPRLLDAQWATPHLLSLGAVEITRAEYHRRLDVGAERFPTRAGFRAVNVPFGTKWPASGPSAHCDQARASPDLHKRVGRCRSSGRSRTAAARARSRRSRRARRSRG